MGSITVTYEEKSKKVYVECDNLFDDFKKTYKGVLKLNPLHIYVEVPLDEVGGDAKAATGTVESNLADSIKEVRKEIEDLGKTLEKLQKEEEHGNKKAASEAEKEVKSTEKSVKKWADGFGAEARKAVQKALETKDKLRSASRTFFRGMELNEDAFDEAAEGSEAPAYVGELSKSLAAVGKEAFKLSAQEKDLRKDLGLEIERVQQAVEKARAGKSGFDIKEFLKANSKDGRALEGNAAKYGDFITSFQEKLEDAKDKWTKLDNLIDKNEKLDDDKDLGKAMKSYGDALDTVAGTLPDKSSLAERAKRLFKEDYKDGDEWHALIDEATRLKGASKSSKLMQDLGAALEKTFKK